MERWEVISTWMKKVYDDDLFRQSAELAGSRLSESEQAWRQFCLIPLEFLKTESGSTDDRLFRSLSAFLMYHWEAGDMAGLSLGNAMSGRYNAASTLLRSFLEIVLNGALFQCLAQDRFRKRPTQALEPTDALRMMTVHLSTIINETGIDASEGETDSAAIFDLLRGDYMQSAFRLKVGSIVRQVTDWGILNGLRDAVDTVLELYGSLSRSVHERIEHTDIGRAVEQGTEIFEWPAPILGESLSEFLGQFHLTMEVGVIVLLNLLHQAFPRDRLRDNSRRLLEDRLFQIASLGQATKLLRSWGE